MNIYLFSEYISIIKVYLQQFNFKEEIYFNNIFKTQE